MSEPTAAPAPEQSSFVEDLVDIWYAPSAVFARRAKSGFFLMLCLVTLAIGGLWIANRGVTQGIMDAEYQRQMAEVMRQNPNVTAEGLAQGRRFADMAQTFGIFIGIPIALFLIGLGTWLVGKVLGASFGYGTAMMIACWSYLPKVAESLLVSVQGLVVDTDKLTGRYQLTLGVGRFVDPDMSPGILGLLGRVDLFTIWVSVLLGIGIVVVGKLPREKLWPAAGLMWLCGAVPAFWTIVWGTIRG